MFRAVSLSIIRSLRLYIQHHVYVIQAATEPVWHKRDAVCTVLDSWWWTERKSETCRVFLTVALCMLPHLLYNHTHALCTSAWVGLYNKCRVFFENKINLRYCAFGWFYYRTKIILFVAFVFVTSVIKSNACYGFVFRGDYIFNSLYAWEPFMFIFRNSVKQSFTFYFISDVLLPVFMHFAAAAVPFCPPPHKKIPFL